MSNQNRHRYRHSTPIQIRFNDIDQLKHVTNSVYQQYFDLGRLSYINEVLSEQMDWESEGLILASITIDYHKPITLYDSIRVYTSVNRIGEKSLQMVQQLLIETTGEAAATSNSVMVCYSNRMGKTIPIPTRWRNRIEQFEEELLPK